MTAWQFSLVEDVLGEIRERVVCGGDVASACTLALTCTYEYAAHRRRVNPVHLGRQKQRWLLAAHAAYCGHFDLYTWARSTSQRNSKADTSSAINAAAEGGQFEFLLRLPKSVYTQNTYVSVGQWAARCGHLAIVEWVLKRRTSHLVDSFVDDMSIRAAEGGQIVMLDFLQTIHRVVLRYRHVDRAASHGQLAMVQWLEEHGIVASRETMRQANEHGNLALIQWLCARKCPFPESMFEDAVRRWHSDAHIQFLIAAGCPMHEQAYIHAAHSGVVARLQLLHDVGCPWSSKEASTAMNNAITSNVLACVVWLHDVKGVTLTLATAINAAAKNATAILQWLIEQKCPMSMGVSIALAKANHMDTLRWLRDTGAVSIVSSRVLKYAALHGDLDMVQWLRAHDCPWHANMWCKVVARHCGDRAMLRWLLDNGCPLPNDAACKEVGTMVCEHD
jgi:hypothetical protein